jgi:hypothetical protein
MANGNAPGLPWPGRTDGQLREVARRFHSALTAAAEAEAALPSDEYLDAQLRERGCPEDQPGRINACGLTAQQISRAKEAGNL